MLCPTCNQEGDAKVVQKPGPNHGRVFYQCPECPGSNGQGKRFIGWNDPDPSPKKRARPENPPQPEKRQKNTVTNEQNLNSQIDQIFNLLTNFKTRTEKDFEQVREEIRELNSMILRLEQTWAPADGP